jgi:hypothetical protein
MWSHGVKVPCRRAGGDSDIITLKRRVLETRKPWPWAVTFPAEAAVAFSPLLEKNRTRIYRGLIGSGPGLVAQK